MSAPSEPSARNHDFESQSARKCYFALIEWAQDARLYGESIYRISCQIAEAPQSFNISKQAWSLGSDDKFRFTERVTERRLRQLQQKNWRSQFILLESIWEVYLEMFYVELSEVFPQALEDLCRQTPPDFLLQSIISAHPPSINDLRTRTAEWLASNLTRKSWSEQWGELQRLKIGLTEKQRKESWWQKLDIYFEMRNCLVHRSGRPSTQLIEKDPAILEQLDESGNIRLSPRQLQFFWIQFLNVLTSIDKSFSGRLRAARERPE